MKLLDLNKIYVELSDTEENAPVPKPKPKPKPKKSTAEKVDGPFIRGPVPLQWLYEVARLSKDNVLSVGLLIWYAKGLGQRKITLDRYIYDFLGVKKDSARRALIRLREAGLIQFRKMGKKFEVTVLPVEPENSTETDKCPPEPIAGD